MKNINKWLKIKELVDDIIEAERFMNTEIMSPQDLNQCLIIQKENPKKIKRLLNE